MAVSAVTRPSVAPAHSVKSQPAASAPQISQAVTKAATKAISQKTV